MSSFTYAPVCMCVLVCVCPKTRRIAMPLLGEELLLSYPTGERKKCCCLLPLCKLASDKGFLGEPQRGFVIGGLRRMGEVRRGYGEKTGTKFPSAYPEPSCYIPLLSFFPSFLSSLFIPLFLTSMTRLLIWLRLVAR